MKTIFFSEDVKRIFKSLIMLSIPTIIEQILGTLMLYVDTAMVGQLGSSATAAVSASASINWLLHSLIYATSIPFLAEVSRAYGERNFEKIKVYSAHALWLTLGMGIILTVVCVGFSPVLPVLMRVEDHIAGSAAEYFLISNITILFRCAGMIFAACIRGMQNTKTPMVINILANVVNAVLDAFLIYGMGMGVKGAAIASAVGITMSGVLMYIYYRRCSELRWSVSQLRLKWDYIRKIFQISLPAMATSIASCMGYVIFASMVSGMGTIVFAAHSIAVSAEELFYIPGYGFRTATSTAVGYAIGEGDEKKEKLTENISIGLVIFAMLLMGLILFLVSDPLMRLFTNDDQVAMLGAKMLRIVAFTEPFFGLMIVMEGIFYGMGKTKGVFLVEALSMWGVRILLTYIVINKLLLSLTEVWYCMIADNIIKALLLVLVLVVGRHMAKRKKGIRRYPENL